MISEARRTYNKEKFVERRILLLSFHYRHTEGHLVQLTITFRAWFEGKLFTEVPCYNTGLFKTYPLPWGLIDEYPKKGLDSLTVRNLNPGILEQFWKIACFYLFFQTKFTNYLEKKPYLDYFFVF